MNVNLFATVEVKGLLGRVKPKENLKMKNSGLRLGSYAKPVEASGLILLRLLTEFRNKETLAGDEHCIAAAFPLSTSGNNFRKTLRACQKMLYASRKEQCRPWGVR